MSQERRTNPKLLNRVTFWGPLIGGYIYNALTPNSLYNQITNDPSMLLRPLSIIHEIPLTLESHLLFLLPYAFGRLFDIASTKYAIHQFKKSGVPLEDIPDQEVGSFHRFTLDLRYRQHRPIAAAISEVGEEIAVLGLAALSPGFAIGYGLVGPVIAHNNIGVANSNNRN